MHGEVTDRAAREPQRLHDEGVGAERQPLADGSDQRGGVGQRRRVAVGERVEEHGVDERRRRLAAGAVGQRDDVVGQARAGDGGTPRCGRGPRPRGRRGAASLSHRTAVPSSRSCTAAHSSKPSAACVSWMRWTLSDATTRQWSTSRRRGHRAAVVAGQPDRQQAAARGLARTRRARSASCRSSTTPRAMSPAVGVGDQLARRTRGRSRRRCRAR